MKNQKGLTLVELVVVIGIIALISSVVLASIGALGANAKVTAAANTVYDTMKKARHDSISVKEFNGSFFPSYGVEFNMATPNKITVYADCVINDVDAPSDVDPPIINEYDSFWNDPLVDTCSGGDFVEDVILPYNSKIKEIRAMSPAFPAAPPVTPAIPALNTTESEVYMEFVRPEPTIWITLGAGGPLLQAGTIEIDVTDPAEKKIKTIVFHSTGQFEIK